MAFTGLQGTQTLSFHNTAQMEARLVFWQSPVASTKNTGISRVGWGGSLTLPELELGARR